MSQRQVFLGISGLVAAAILGGALWNAVGPRIVKRAVSATLWPDRGNLFTAHRLKLAARDGSREYASPREPRAGMSAKHHYRGV